MSQLDKKSHNCSACHGCQYAGNRHGGWCYMFEHAPDNLPCSQHDCFSLEREIASAIIRKNPGLLTAMVFNELDRQRH